MKWDRYNDGSITQREESFLEGSPFNPDCNIFGRMALRGFCRCWMEDLAMTLVAYRAIRRRIHYSLNWHERTWTISWRENYMSDSQRVAEHLPNPES